MILSVSRRTDIPAFYSEWFFNRIHAGFVDVRNPMNIHQVSRVNIRPEVVDCIVFWTKDATKIFPRLNELSGYNYYFQYTINPYNNTIERDVPQKYGLIENFKVLSRLIGPERVIWRYDPILLTPEIDLQYHIRYFEELAKRLSGYTRRCVISFVDLYKKTKTNTQDINVRELQEPEILKLSIAFSSIADKYGIVLQSCSESINLEKYDISHGCCIDKNLIESVFGCHLQVTKDKNQRKECGCIQSIDIGAYNTCKHQCKYCYANFNNDIVLKQSSMHNPMSSILVGELKADDVITIRKVELLATMNLFDM